MWNREPSSSRVLRERVRSATARVGVQEVYEHRVRAGGEVQERQRLDGRAESGGKSSRVLMGLDLDSAQGVALGLRLEYADGFAIHEQHVVHASVSRGELELTHRNTASGRQIHLVSVLESPTSFPERGINLLRGPLLRSKRIPGAATRRWGT